MSFEPQTGAGAGCVVLVCVSIGLFGLVYLLWQFVRAWL